MNLHIFHDSNFIELTQEVFAFGKLENYYFILSEVPVEGHYSSGNKTNLVKVIKELSPERIIIHNLTSLKIEAILESKTTAKIHWSSWGNDIYNAHFGYSFEGLLDTETLRFYKENDFNRNRNIIYRKKGLTRKILLFIYKITKRKQHSFELFEKFLPKISSCSTVIPSDFEIIKRKQLTIVYKPFSYGFMDILIPSKDVKEKSFSLGNKILVGNSATIENNHIDVLEKMKDFSVLVPAVYGDELYKTKLLRKYKLNEDIEFMNVRRPYNEYVRHLMNCNTMIMNHVRQQALGNIIIGLSLGMRVYLNFKNPIYSFLKNLGIHVFDFHNEFRQYGNTPITETQFQENLIGLESYWGKEVVKKRMELF